MHYIGAVLPIGKFSEGRKIFIGRFFLKLKKMLRLIPVSKSSKGKRIKIHSFNLKHISAPYLNSFKFNV